MPVTYTLSGSILRMDFIGKYEPQEIIDQFQAALADPRCPTSVALLVDVTQSESLETRAPHEIRIVAEALGPHRERIGGRCAVIAKKDVHFGLSKMGSVFSEGVGVETGVFRNAESALEWLGVPL